MDYPFFNVIISGYQILSGFFPSIKLRRNCLKTNFRNVITIQNFRKTVMKNKNSLKLKDLGKVSLYFGLIEKELN